VKAGGDKENRAHQNGTDATENGYAVSGWNVMKVCLMSVYYDQCSEDQEAEGQADQTPSDRNPPEYMLVRRPVGRFSCRL
jgi:hypothetical protein